MIGAFTDHLWQSTVFVLAAALVAAALRQNGAHIRHRIWLVASLKFLVPLSLLMSIGGALPRIAPAMPVTDTTTVSDLSITVDRIAQPFTSDPFTPTLTTSRVFTCGPSIRGAAPRRLSRATGTAAFAPRAGGPAP